MSVTKADALLGEAAAFIAVADSGDSEMSALEQAAIRIEAAMRENPALTQRDVAARVGKGTSYVHTLLVSLARGRETGQFAVDWRRGPTNRETRGARRLAREEPKVLVKVLYQAIAEATPEQREEIVEAITDTTTVGGRHVENKVRERERERREKEWQERSNHVDPPPATGIPLSVAWSGIMLKVDGWARGLSNFDDAMVDELVEVNPVGAEKIAGTVERLGVQVQRLLLGLRGRRTELGEGNVIDMPMRTNDPRDLVDVVADRL